MHEPLSRRITDTPVEWRILHRDYETRSRANLKACGATRYAADPSVERRGNIVDLSAILRDVLDRRS
jgi:hypothetical protein